MKTIMRSIDEVVNGKLKQTESKQSVFNWTNQLNSPIMFKFPDFGRSTERDAFEEAV